MSGKGWRCWAYSSSSRNQIWNIAASKPARMASFTTPGRTQLPMGINKGAQSRSVSAATLRERMPTEMTTLSAGIKISLPSLSSTKCSAITDEGVQAVDKDGREILIPADSVVISVGMRPLSAAVEALRDCAPEFIPIGNCVRPGVVKDAIRAGFDAAMFQI